ncbi:MAG: hypothetical protein ABI599_11515 [Flavobacteriales bacterium]
MEKLINRLRDLAAKKDRFVYDLRGNCVVYSGVVCPYRAITADGNAQLSVAILDALEHESILMGSRGIDGTAVYESCRLFTNVDQAMRFAKSQGRNTVYSLNRQVLLEVEARPVAA